MRGWDCISAAPAFVCGMCAKLLVVCLPHSLPDLEQHALHLVDRALLHVGQHMRVSVEGELDARMP
jgi:hypothetical protein